jgi:hypothetical protein
MTSLSRADISRLLELLNSELAKEEVIGEIFLVGGAVMTLVYQARPSTKDLDAFFIPAKAVRRAAARVAAAHELPPDWLNDAVKGFLSKDGTFTQYATLSNLRVMVADPSYLLAMKCLSMRLGAEFSDESDVRYLLRHLNISDYKEALNVIQRYYPLKEFPQKTLYALEEILEDSTN